MTKIVTGDDINDFAIEVLDDIIGVPDDEHYFDLQDAIVELIRDKFGMDKTDAECRTYIIDEIKE